jgi:hypothetical protein
MSDGTNNGIACFRVRFNNEACSCSELSVVTANIAAGLHNISSSGSNSIRSSVAMHAMYLLLSVLQCSIQCVELV